MGHNGLKSAKRVADVTEAVDLFVNRFESLLLPMGFVNISIKEEPG